MVSRTCFLCCPPTEANSIVDSEVGQLNSDFKESNSSRSVVVDTRASSNRVRVTTDVDDIVVVSIDGLGDDIESLVELDFCPKCYVDVDTSLELSEKCFTLTHGDACDWHKFTLGVQHLQRVSLKSAFSVVPGDDGRGTLGRSELDFDAVGACAALDQGD